MASSSTTPPVKLASLGKLPAELLSSILEYAGQDNEDCKRMYRELCKLSRAINSAATPLLYREFSDKERSCKSVEKFLTTITQNSTLGGYVQRLELRASRGDDRKMGQGFIKLLETDVDDRKMGQGSIKLLETDVLSINKQHISQIRSDTFDTGSGGEHIISGCVGATRLQHLAILFNPPDMIIRYLRAAPQNAEFLSTIFTRQQSSHAQGLLGELQTLEVDFVDYRSTMAQNTWSDCHSLDLETSIWKAIGRILCSPTISRLSLNFPFLEDLDHVANPICHPQNRVRHLEIGGTHRLSPSILLYFLTSCSSLETLKINQPSLENQSISLLFQSWFEVLRVQSESLTELTLASVEILPDVSFSTFTKLTKLAFHDATCASLSIDDGWKPKNAEFFPPNIQSLAVGTPAEATNILLAMSVFAINAPSSLNSIHIKLDVSDSNRPWHIHEDEKEWKAWASSVHSVSQFSLEFNAHMTNCTIGTAKLPKLIIGLIQVNQFFGDLVTNDRSPSFEDYVYVRELDSEFTDLHDLMCELKVSRF